MDTYIVMICLVVATIIFTLCAVQLYLYFKKNIIRRILSIFDIEDIEDIINDMKYNINKIEELSSSKEDDNRNRILAIELEEEEIISTREIVGSNGSSFRLPLDL